MAARPGRPISEVLIQCLIECRETQRGLTVLEDKVKKTTDQAREMEKAVVSLNQACMKLAEVTAKLYSQIGALGEAVIEPEIKIPLKVPIDETEKLRSEIIGTLRPTQEFGRWMAKAAKTGALEIEKVTENYSVMRSLQGLVEKRLEALTKAQKLMVEAGLETAEINKSIETLSSGLEVLTKWTKLGVEEFIKLKTLPEEEVVKVKKTIDYMKNLTVET